MKKETAKSQSKSKNKIQPMALLLQERNHLSAVEKNLSLTQITGQTIMKKARKQEHIQISMICPPKYKKD